jgi:hypothetical protein
VLDLQPAVAEDAARLHALREAAARWLQARGIRQWQPAITASGASSSWVAASSATAPVVLLEKPLI